jgi:hypothetical protein
MDTRGDEPTSMFKIGRRESPVSYTRTCARQLDVMGDLYLMESGDDRKLIAKTLRSLLLIQKLKI